MQTALHGKCTCMHRHVQLGMESLNGYEQELVADIKEQNEALLKNLTSRTKDLDSALKECLKEEAALQQKAALMQSVPGIGLQTAVYMLIVSKDMQSFDSPRKFACYSGCAPFEHQSGCQCEAKAKFTLLLTERSKAYCTWLL